MGENTYLLLSLAFANMFMIAHAQNGTECIYEGQRFKADRSGQLPLETHKNCETDMECRDICDSKPTCIIWQWQPDRKICWIMNVEPYLDRNSDFGINHCDKGKPTENALLCQVTIGDRDNIWEDQKDMTKEECVTKCDDDSDCLIWQYIRNRKLCRIHKLEVDLSKSSLVGIHYCKPGPSCSVENRAGIDGLWYECDKMVNCSPNKRFKYKHVCYRCNSKEDAFEFSKRRITDQNHVYPYNTVIAIKPNTKIWYRCNKGPYKHYDPQLCTGKAEAVIYFCQLKYGKVVYCKVDRKFREKLGNAITHQECYFQHYSVDGHFKQIQCEINGELVQL